MKGLARGLALVFTSANAVVLADPDLGNWWALAFGGLIAATASYGWSD